MAMLGQHLSPIRHSPKNPLQPLYFSDVYVCMYKIFILEWIIMLQP